MADGGASRRQVLMGVGAVGAAGVLAACGDDPAGPGGPASPSPGASTPTTPSAGQPTTPPPAEGIAASDIPVGGGQIYTDRRVVVTQPTAGEFRAFDIVCPHQGCFVGEVSEGRITCPCHGSQFAITDGSVLRGPVTGQPLTRGLTAKTATLDGDVVVVS